ncbi:3-methyladenine DNA glycosylase AlkC [Tenacibaculum sp. MAR_2009_124]|uniref:DNA alkylation repair protein n=1 Tax=Tenacibaculum sp. MAR_2009_124 TaxID=1250059 RepID=UPI0008995F31|nr:DNA alkylation repair protein [Tenacibaculum sp. MAR_2009_124]SEB38581.1 3-methyladenine DNA glycosylase AlkC [Tenacibaculum sp. MAR_2009_124]
MAELFKNIYNTKFINQFSEILEQVVSDFKRQSFVNSIFNADWEAMELKQRMRHISVTLNNHLSTDFEKNADLILKVIDHLEEQNIRETSIEYMFFPDYIEVFGLDHYDISIKAIERITQFTSCEFAVRPFIIKYPEEMIPQLQLWGSHEHHMVRRLATEGCRPRLPWAMAIPSLKENPNPILPILEKLKEDATEIVRRSVANNLNDIAKDNPKIVIDIAKRWIGKSKELDWVVKHGCRTLLKQGEPKVMKLFGFGSVDHIEIQNFSINTPSVKVGDSLEFSFQIKNNSKESSKLRLEYGLYYQKANGTLSKKVFKISEKEYPANSSTNVTRKQSFKIITTRKFHLGLHQVSVIVALSENSLFFKIH